MPFTDDFVSPSRFGSEFRADINVFLCAHCKIAQTQHDVDVSDYYEDYHYSVGGSQTVSAFMSLLAENLKSLYYPDSDGQKVLEVGSGDGEQLVAFRNTGCRVLGYEPSSQLCAIAAGKGVESIHGLFDHNSIGRLPDEFQTVDVIMLSYTFDHLPEPREFLSACRSILNPETGLLVVEVHDLEKIVNRQEYCLFEHEHSVYLTETTAKLLCGMEGLEIIDFDLVPQHKRRGNSLIFVATPRGSRFGNAEARPRTPKEFAEIEFYQRVERDITGGIRNLDDFVGRTVAEGRTVAGYGAGGRGVMTLAAMKSACEIKYLADRNPKGDNLVTPRSGVRLSGVEKLVSDPADEVLVFSFGYMSEISETLGAVGYKSEQLHSLLDLLAGRS